MNILINLILVLSLTSCSFYSVKEISGSEILDESVTCSKYIFGIPLENGGDPIKAARKSGINKIGAVSSELFFPLLPIFVSDCTYIHGSSVKTK